MSQTRLARGIYVDADCADDLVAQCFAMLRAAPPGAVVSGRTAAVLHEMRIPRSDGRPIELTVTATDRAARSLARPRRPEVRVHRRHIAPTEVTRLNGLPITTPAATWFDLAASCSLPDLVAAGDGLLRSGVTSEVLQEHCAHARWRRGVRRAMEAVPLLDARADSRPESHLRMAVRHPGLPEFAVNESVFDEYGQWLAKPDLSCAEARLALEYQGAHHANPDQMRRDLTRVTELRRAGWEVLLYGPAEVLQRPERIAPEVRDIVFRRAPHLLRAA